jgi:hypothetical protein
MFKTLALMGLTYLVTNQPARHKFEQFLKYSINNGLSNFNKAKKGVEDARKPDETISPVSNQPNATLIMQ